MDSRSIRVWLAGSLFIGFLVTYAVMLYDFATVKIPDSVQMATYLRKSRTFRELLFIVYLVSNAVMCLTFKSQFEKELLMTGVFSVVIISLLRTLHNLSILVMSTQWTLILICGITIAFFLIVLTEGKRNDLFRD